MNYTIGQVAEMFQLPVSTLRYYDREGLFPGMQRQSGARVFTQREVEALRVIECLKASGLQICEIRQFMTWAEQGPETYPQRRALFEERRRAVEAEIDRLRRTLDMVRYKCWYYAQAEADGGEEALCAMLPDHLPAEVQALYDSAHR